MNYILFVALGGAAGAVARFLLGEWVHGLWEHRLPLGTLLVNVVGSAAMGFLYVLLAEKMVLHPDWRGVLMVGFLGAFTTFSTFSLETVALLEAGLFATALGYIALSVSLCLLATVAAVYAGRLIL